MTEEARALQVREETRPARVRARRLFAPAVDILESDDAILILADMPGVDKNTLEITLDKNRLTIRGSSGYEAPSGYDLDFSEWESGDYERVFTLDEDIDRDNIQATLEHGVLHVRLPKAGAAIVRRIPVKTA